MCALHRRGVAVCVGGLVLAGLASSAPPSPAFPGAVGKLVFHGPDNRLLHLYIANPDGSAIRQITTGSGLDQGPVWSPDGRHIAFARQRGWNLDIYIRATNGSIVRLTTAAADDFAPAWSPEGSRLAFARAIGNPEVYTMNRDGSEQRRLVAGQAPAWSPDGRLIAVGRLSGRGASEKVRIFTIRPNGTGLRRVTPLALQADEPAWSPDGRRIAFTLVNEPLVSSDIAVVDRDGSNFQRLTFDHEGQDVSPAWSPDGRTIAFARITPSAGPSVERLYTMNADGSGVILITPGSEGGAPDWQPLCTIRGRTGGDRLAGTDGVDVICGSGGNDVIHAHGANDVVFGGTGDDTIYGGDGSDVLVGGTGHDRLYGRRGSDLLNVRDGHEANDVISGGRGSDICLADEGDRKILCP